MTPQQEKCIVIIIVVILVAIIIWFVWHHSHKDSMRDHGFESSPANWAAAGALNNQASLYSGGTGALNPVQAGQATHEGLREQKLRRNPGQIYDKWAENVAVNAGEGTRQNSISYLGPDRDPYSPVNITRDYSIPLRKRMDSQQPRNAQEARMKEGMDGGFKGEKEPYCYAGSGHDLGAQSGLSYLLSANPDMLKRHKQWYNEAAPFSQTSTNVDSIDEALMASQPRQGTMNAYRAEMPTVHNPQQVNEVSPDLIARQFSRRDILRQC